MLGSAHALPFRDGAFDLVSLRHVLHHLPDPATALREAWRVARRGVAAAEPWFPVDRPEEECARNLELWSRRVDRALGRHHEPGHDPREILDLHPPPAGAALVVDRFSTGARRDPEDFLRDHAALLAQLGPAHPLALELPRLLDAARDRGLGRPGTAILLAVRDHESARRRRGPRTSPSPE